MRKRKRVADFADCEEAEAGAGPEAQAGAEAQAEAADDDGGTGSDTEWSEGFSSDDEAKRSARAPKRVRRLARAARELECTESHAAVAPAGAAVTEAQRSDVRTRDLRGWMGTVSELNTF